MEIVIQCAMYNVAITTFSALSGEVFIVLRKNLNFLVKIPNAFSTTRQAYDNWCSIVRCQWD